MKAKTIRSLPKARLLTACLLLFSLFFIHQSCTKIDTSMPAGKAFTDAELAQRFFDVPATAPFAVHRAADALRARDHHLPFAAAFSRQNGIPKWDKATVVGGSKASARNVGLATEEGDTLVILPVLQEGSSNVESFISMRLHGDADMAFYRGGDYSAYTYEDVPDSTVNADKAALQMMWLNYQVSGTTRFIVNDDKLFMPGGGIYTGPHPRIIKMDEPSAPVQAGKSISIQICTYVPGANGCTCWHHNPSQCTCNIPDCCWRRSCWYMNFPTDGGPFDDGGSGPGSEPGGDQGGGGSPGFPCAGSQGKNIGIANPCGGGGPTIPPVEPIPPVRRLNPCEYIDSLSKSEKFQQVINNLKDSLDQQHEIAYTYTDPLNPISSTLSIYYSGASDTTTLAVDVQIAGKADGMGHNHYNHPDRENIYTPEDLGKLYSYYRDHHMKDPATFTYPLVTNSSGFIIMITDTAKFGAFGRSSFTTYQGLKGLDRLMYEYNNISKDSSSSANAVHLLQTLKGLPFGGCGIKLFMSTSNSQVHYIPVGENNGTLVLHPCQ